VLPRKVSISYLFLTIFLDSSTKRKIEEITDVKQLQNEIEALKGELKK